MISETSALLTSFNAIEDITKAMLSLRDIAEINTKVIELQDAIITAQTQAMSIQQNYSALEQKHATLKKNVCA